MPPGPCLAATRLETVPVRVRRVLGAVIAVTVPHRETVLDDYREFLADKIPSVVTVPPCTATVEFRGIARCLVMHAKTVGIFPIALTPVRVVVVVAVAVEEIMTAPAAGAALVHEKPCTLVVVTVNLFQKYVLAA